ncbi:MAG TPA: GntR family transcriptional regulator [Thermoanaerobacterales bacterium]|nr:GntR family transcriptional regulator [Thermoanaerobacterales bacterium]
MNAEFEFFQSNTLVDMAYKEIKKDITLNTLKPGQKIILRDLCERYGISETPIKQALNRLLMEGLIESAPRKSMRVKRIKLEEIDELLEIRLMIETFYVNRILQTLKSNPEIKEKFLKNLEEHRKVVENIEGLNDFYRHLSLDQEFHQIYIECSDNKKVLQIYNNLGTHIYMYHVYWKQGKARMKEAFQEHKAIFDALVIFDENKLLEMVKKHIYNTKQDIQQIWEKQV